MIKKNIAIKILKTFQNQILPIANQNNKTNQNDIKHIRKEWTPLRNLRGALKAPK